MIDETVVVGAGPYGLSAAAHLRSRGVPTRVFGDAMGAWRDHMPAGMMLKSLPSATSISSPKAGSLLGDYCAELGGDQFDRDSDIVPLDLFVEYGRWFANRNVPDVEAQSVERVERAGDAFSVTLADGEELRTRTVVVASGHVAHRYIPRVLAPLVPIGASHGVLSHTCSPSNLSAFVGQRVLIVGAGQSALENAALLHEAGADVTVLVRESSLEWIDPPECAPRSRMQRLMKPSSPLGPGWSYRAVTGVPQLIRHLAPSTRLKLVEQVRGPSGAWWLRDRVEGRIDIRFGTSVTRAEVGDDCRVMIEYVDAYAELNYLVVDHVIAATGYRVDLDNLEFLDASVLADIDRVPGSGSPELDPAFESTVPGLFFTGLAAAATFGPVMRFVCGTEFAGPRIQNPSISRAPMRRPSRSAS